MAITRIKAETALSGTIPSTNISQASMANVSTGTSWQAVKTTSFTAESGKGYFVDTTSGAITVTMPSSASAGDYIVLKDYARNWGTNNVTIASTLMDGQTSTKIFSTDGQTVTLVYMDGTKGWSLTNEDTTSNLGTVYISATGGTVTTSGNYKTHVFTGDGCFVVSEIGNQGANADYLVVAGGGGGGSRYYAGGGGAGGFRVSNSTCMPAPLTSPLASPTGITLTATTYPITVGSGGAAGPGYDTPGSSGSNSVFSTITSTGGGLGGASVQPGANGGSGGSGGGGGGNCGSGGNGNTPPVSPSQGNSGGNGNIGPQAPEGGGGGGGGGASASGTNSTLGTPQSGNGGVAGNGGEGSYVVAAGFGGCYGTPGPVVSTKYFAGGGGGGDNSIGSPTGTGGSGGGGRGAPSSLAGTANTGGGGGGGSHDGNPPACGAAGGSGIVIIRYRYQ